MTNEQLMFRLARQRMEDLAREGQVEQTWRRVRDERRAETPQLRTPRRLRRILLALR